MLFFRQFKLHQQNGKKHPYARRLTGYKDTGQFDGEFAKIKKLPPARKNQRLVDIIVFINNEGIYQFGNCGNDSGYRFFYTADDGTQTYRSIYEILVVQELITMQNNGFSNKEIRDHLATKGHIQI